MRGRVFRWLLPLALLAVAGVGASMAASAAMRSGGTVKAAKSAAYGAVLVAANGKTLYRYTPDRKHLNTCTPVAACAKEWPRLLVHGGARPTAGPGVKASLIGTIAQPGGLRQVTYAGFPLYSFAGDKKAGQTKGQGYDGDWYLVNTKGALVKHAMAGAKSPAPAPAPTTTAAGGGDAWG